MALHRFIVVVTIAIVIILAGVIWLVPINDDFRIENPSWNGAMALTTDYRLSPLKSLSGLPSIPEDSVLILIPYLDFNPAELEALKSFIAVGGRLVLADDYGYGNQVLEYLELKARFSGKALLDPLVNYKNKAFPRILNIQPDAITRNVKSLTLNHATSLTGVSSDEVLAQSSSFSFIDLDGNQTRDANEPAGPLPVISRHKISEGEVILIADPSLFINSMEASEDNRILIQNIANTGKSNLFIDQSHLPSSNLRETKTLLAYVRDSLTAPAGTIGVVLLALTITLVPLWRERRQD